MVDFHHHTAYGILCQILFIDDFGGAQPPMVFSAASQPTLGRLATRLGKDKHTYSCSKANLRIFAVVLHHIATSLTSLL